LQASILGIPGGGTPTGPIMGDDMLEQLEMAGLLTPSKRRLLNMPAQQGGQWPTYNARGQMRGTAQVDGSAQR
jgi:hypothetical protein